MAASIDEVAQRAGVSIATVSRALRGMPDVAAATRQRVWTAARELDYVASPFAARLASGHSCTVGVVVPFVNRWFFAEILDAIESVLSDAGYDLLLNNLADVEGRERFFTTLPVRKRVEAVLVASLALTEVEVAALKTCRSRSGCWAATTRACSRSGSTMWPRRSGRCSICLIWGIAGSG